MESSMEFEALRFFGTGSVEASRSRGTEGSSELCVLRASSGSGCR
jgi:hypothetical protein